MAQFKTENTRAIHAWESNAAFWDQQMGEGNEFFNTLLWPSVERLLLPVPGERLLDIACGNGLTSRKLAQMNCAVTAIDGSPAMIAAARQRSGPHEIDYRVVDVTDRDALSTLGTFDGTLCNMALMDIADVNPLMTALAGLLKPGGRFVFSIVHPCFNNPSTIQMGEVEDRDGALVTTYSVKIARYLTPFTKVGLAMRGQPEPHPYFHRPLGLLLTPSLAAGLVLDGLEERAFPPERISTTNPLSWNGHFSEIPPALIVRLRRL